MKAVAIKITETSRTAATNKIATSRTEAATADVMITAIMAMVRAKGIIVTAVVVVEMMRPILKCAGSMSTSTEKRNSESL